MFIIQRTINEQKVLKRLEANSKKPLKKSKWQQRIEALEKQNQALIAERQKQQNKRRKLTKKKKKKKKKVINISFLLNPFHFIWQ